MLKRLKTTSTIPDQPKVVDLITAIDKAIYSPQEWRLFLDKLSDSFPRLRISLVSFDKSHRKPAIVFSTDPSPCDRDGAVWHNCLSRSVQEDLAATDLWSILYCDQSTSENARQMDAKTRVTSGGESQTFASNMILKLFDDGDRLGILRFELPQENAEALRTSIVWLVSQLIPHLRRAVENSRKLNSSSFFRSAHTALLDSRPDPAFVLCSQLRIIHANPAALDALNQQRGLHTDPDGQLMLLDDAAHQALLATSEEFSCDALTTPDTLASRPTPELIRFRVDGERNPNVLFLFRLNRTFDFFNTPVTAYACEDALFAVLKYRSHRVEVRHELLQSLFEFTKSEANMIGALVEGQTLKQYAEQSQTAIGTVRWHLKNIMTKTSCKSQTELIRLILNIGTVHI